MAPGVLGLAVGLLETHRKSMGSSVDQSIIAKFENQVQNRAPYCPEMMEDGAPSDDPDGAKKTQLRGQQIDVLRIGEHDSLVPFTLFGRNYTVCIFR